jgi:hypothetical protein
MSSITPAAYRIAKAHNETAPTLVGGFLAFRADGTGGEWYSAGSRPDAAILYPVSDRYVTSREVQDWLDDWLDA